MRTLFPAAALAFAACVAAQPAAAEDRAAKGEAELAEALEGFTAGEPVDCITLTDIRDTDIVDGTAIIYKRSRNQLYVNRLGDNCSNLRDDYATVSRTPSTRLCRGDILTLIDPPSPMSYGSCALGDFVPYTRGR